MGVLIPLREFDGVVRVSSETIAQGSGVQHKNVLELIDSKRADFEEFGQVAFETRPGYNNSTVRVAQLNEPQATLLMTYQRNTDQVRLFKKALVRAFFDLAKQTVQVPKTLPEALRAYANEVEANESLRARIKSDAPKVLFADSVATADTTILVGDLAKILRGNGVEVGANRLFAMLRDEGYLMRCAGSAWNMPTQYAMELGLFQVKETAITHADGHVTVRTTPKVTGKGQQYFIDRYMPVGVS